MEQNSRSISGGDKSFILGAILFTAVVVIVAGGALALTLDLAGH